MSGPSIADVPCAPCQLGYAHPHPCDNPRHCPCDRWSLHIAAEPPAAEEPAKVEEKAEVTLHLMSLATGGYDSPRKVRLDVELEDTGVYVELDEHQFAMLMGGHVVKVREA